MPCVDDGDMCPGCVVCDPTTQLRADLAAAREAIAVQDQALTMALGKVQAQGKELAAARARALEEVRAHVRREVESSRWSEDEAEAITVCVDVALNALGAAREGGTR